MEVPLKVFKDLSFFWTPHFIGPLRLYFVRGWKETQEILCIFNKLQPTLSYVALEEIHGQGYVIVLFCFNAW
jgi:hypothetical protein